MKRKRITNHGNYIANGSSSPQTHEQRPWQGYVHAWPGAPHAPALLDARPPQAYSANTPVQYGGFQYAAPPSVL
jgi:hypothetical protein